MVGTDLSAGWVDLGTTNMPFARQNVPNPFAKEIQHELPLFKITCNVGTARAARRQLQ